MKTRGFHAHEFIEFVVLGEKVTTEIAKVEDAQGFVPNKSAAKRGGTVAGDARKATEKEIKRPVSTKENYLKEPESVKRRRIKGA